MSGLNGRPFADGSPPDDRAPSADVDVLSAELYRLESEIAVEQARIEAARARQAEANTALRQVVTSVRSRLAEMERQHAQRVDAVRSAAAAEAEEVVETARRRADEMPRHEPDGEGKP